MCQYHPDVPGVGICVRCRTVICAACCTRLQGINHCHKCLKALGRRRGEATAGSGATFVALAILGVAWAALFGLFWLVQGRLAP